MSNMHVMRSIPDYFRDKTILITGSTGFLGKSLVAKILTNMPEIAKLYLLIRSRKSPAGIMVSAADRLKNELLTADVFENLRKQHGDRFTTWMVSKVEALEGDLAEERFGLPDDVYASICREIQVIINCAALVKFDPPIDQSLKNNTLSAKYAVNFAKNCNNAVFIHVSTAFVCGFRPGLVPEEIYQPLIEGPQPANGKMKVVPLELEAEIVEITRLSAEVRAEADHPHRNRRFKAEALKMIRNGNGKIGGTLEEQIEYVRSQWVESTLVDLGLERAKMHGWIDTYTNMKALGEQMVIRERGDLPTAIIRPSIIESSLKDPNPGWLDGLRMVDPLIISYGKGRLADFPGDTDSLVDIIPVDFVTNAILAATVYTHEQGGFKIYNVATGPNRSITVRQFYLETRHYFQMAPMFRNGEPVVVPTWKFPKLKKFQRTLRFMIFRLELGSWLLRLLPLKWADRQSRRFAVILKALKWLQYYVRIYSPYMQLHAEFDTANTQELFRALATEDREKFNFDTSSIDIPSYLREVHIPGIKQYVMKLDKEGLALENNQAQGDSLDSARIGTD